MDLSSEFDDETFGKLYDRRKTEVSEKICGEHGISKIERGKYRSIVSEFERDWKLSAYNKFVKNEYENVWEAIICSPALLFYIEAVYISSGDIKETDSERPWFADFGLAKTECMFII